MITKIKRIRYHYNLNDEAFLPTSHKFSSYPPPNGLPMSNKNLHKNL